MSDLFVGSSRIGDVARLPHLISTGNVARLARSTSLLDFLILSLLTACLLRECCLAFFM